MVSPALMALNPKTICRNKHQQEYHSDQSKHNYQGHDVSGGKSAVAEKPQLGQGTGSFSSIKTKATRPTRATANRFR